MSAQERIEPQVELVSAAPSGLHPTWIHNRFDDKVWRMRATEGSQQHNIDFGTVAAEFRLNCKFFLWALEYETDRRYSKFRMTTGKQYLQFFYEYRSFTNFLAKRGVGSLGEAARSQCIAHLKNRRDMKLEADQPTRPVRMYTARCLQALYRLGPCGSGALPDGLSILLSAGDIDALLKHEVPTGETPVLPDDVAQALFSASIDILPHAANLCLLAKHERAFRRSKDFPGVKNAQKAHHAREQWLIQHGLVEETKEALWAILPLHDLAFKERLEGSAWYGGVHFGAELTIMVPNRLNDLIRYVCAAAFILFAVLTGFRMGEIFSLDRSGLRAADDRLMVTTRITKGTGRQLGILSERPAPTILQDVHAALMLVADVFGKDATRLWWHTKGGRITINTLKSLLSDFIVEFVGITDYSLTSRLFRKYFAIFYIRRFLGPDDALRHHFRHISPLALRAYVSDRRGARFLIEAKQELLREIIGSVQSGDGRFISRGAIKVTVDYNITVLPEKELLTSELQAAVQAGGGEVYPQAWGICVLQISGSPTAACGSRNGMPNPVEAYPENCSRCPHLVIGEAQQGFWRQNRAAYQKMADSIHVNAATKRRVEAFIGRIDTMIASFEKRA